MYGSVCNIGFVHTSFRSIYSNETGSECGQIQCYTKSHTLIVLLLLARAFITSWQSPTSVSSTFEYISVHNNYRYLLAGQLPYPINCLRRSHYCTALGHGYISIHGGRP